MTDPPRPANERGAARPEPPLPPALARYGPWEAAGRAPSPRPWPLRSRRRRQAGGALVRRRRSPVWSPVATTAAAIGGAFVATSASPLALDAAGPAAAGWWALTGASVALGGAGLVLRLRLAAHGPDGARALEAEVWASHTRSVPGGQVVDAPGQDRWRFSAALGEVERRAGAVPAAERAALLAEARTVAVGASRLLRDGPGLGQATLRLFPDSRFGRLDLTGDDAVAGAAAAYRRLLDDAERQLRDLAAALQELAAGRAPAGGVGDVDLARLHALVSLAELDADPTTSGGRPALERRADELRAQAAAEAELDGG